MSRRVEMYLLSRRVELKFCVGIFSAPSCMEGGLVYGTVDLSP